MRKNECTLALTVNQLHYLEMLLRNQSAYGLYVKSSYYGRMNTQTLRKVVAVLDSLIPKRHTMLLHLDTTDLGKAAAANFAAAWLYATVQAMHAANAARSIQGYAVAYDENSFIFAREDAEKMVSWKKEAPDAT